MISSAVVIPDPPRERTPPPQPHLLKRRLSNTPVSDSKRPRVEVDELQYDEPQSQDSRSPTIAQGRDNGHISPPRRKSSGISATNAVEEKKRNKRLFGGLLGTLSQTATKPAHKKRDEIESRQRERMRQQTEEEEDRRKRRKVEIEQRRRAEQNLWNEEAIRQRHRDLRARAGFLRTRTEPSLFYKPWELRPKEEDEIARQKKDVERTIRRELGQDEEMSDGDEVTGHIVEVSKSRSRSSSPKSTSGDRQQQSNGTQEHLKQHHNDDGSANKESADEKGTTDESKQVPKNGALAQHTEEPQPQQQQVHNNPNSQLNRQDEHHNEELVEGQEDDVIY